MGIGITDRNLVHVMPIRIPHRIRIRIMVVAASVIICFIRFALSIRRCKPVAFKGGQLNCPASANKFRDLVERGVALAKHGASTYGKQTQAPF